MDAYEQMEIDVRLESEKDLKTNVGKVIKFFYDKRRVEAEESGWPLKRVESKPSMKATESRRRHTARSEPKRRSLRTAWRTI